MTDRASMKRDEPTRKSNEAGFTLVELLVATMLSIVLLGVAVGIFTSLLGSEPRTSARSVQIESGRVMLERITRELRQGMEVAVTDGGSQLVVNTRACDGEAEICEVSYVCADGACARAEDDGSALLVVDGLETTFEVFREDPASPHFIEVWLSFPRAEGGEAVTLGDGVAVRNFVEPPEEET